MAVRKDNAKGKWIAEFYQGEKRVRRWFATKGEATRFFNQMKLENVKPLEVEGAERLGDLIQLWFDLHGQTLVKAQQTFNSLKAMCVRLGNPYVSQFSVEQFAEYRKMRLNGDFVGANGVREKPVKQSTVNLELALLKGVFGELIRLGKWSGENPLKPIRKFRLAEPELVFLREAEIERLLVACQNSGNLDLLYVVKLCLATGARWSEAAELHGSQLVPYKVIYTKTKSKKNRAVPISRELYDEIPKKQGRLFNVGAEHFRAVAKAAGLNLPRGKNTHVLRHTFASHFMMNGGNILVLRDILGHHSIEMTMVYAHFAPAYLETAVVLNPLAKVLGEPAV